MISWTVSAIATVLVGTAVFGGFLAVTPAVLDVAVVTLAASGAHMGMGLLEGPD
ncbi:MAG: hypothetical protein JNK84_03405 [Phreatobacter sp.]|uniref:hypothetical protein n=1 Tax=Phreatobacter sp. TaxID=1966341 RepID=UPI001A6231EF|nr:hypothetical protein [Phreatobacter sp.]MBL8568111.1 hypothetical protein [Phreatobacter sp.]